MDGRPAQISFWNYRTLQGHVEAGQRDYEVWKWLDTGDVEFRTHAVSRPAETSALIRAGFQLLGRHKQVEFGRRACRADGAPDRSRAPARRCRPRRPHL